MSDTAGKPYREGSSRRRRSGSKQVRYAPVDDTYTTDPPRKKNLRLHQSKIDDAKRILGTATETETIEAALDLVVFRSELADGVRAMRGANLANLFDDPPEEPMGG